MCRWYEKLFIKLLLAVEIESIFNVKQNLSVSHFYIKVSIKKLIKIDSTAVISRLWENEYRKFLGVSMVDGKWWLQYVQYLGKIFFSEILPESRMFHHINQIQIQQCCQT